MQKLMNAYSYFDDVPEQIKEQLKEDEKSVKLACRFLDCYINRKMSQEEIAAELQISISLVLELENKLLNGGDIYEL